MTEKPPTEQERDTEVDAGEPGAATEGEGAKIDGGDEARYEAADARFGDADDEPEADDDADDDADDEADPEWDDEFDDDEDFDVADENVVIAELRGELAELNDRHLRLAAEFNNFRRRHETQMTEAWGRAQADLLGRLLDVLDDLQRVALLDPADEAVTVESIVEGIDLVERKFVRAVADAGAEVLDPAEGEAFDPERMEAMMRVDDETGERDDQVAAVFQKGYTFKGNLVRPARVSVYKA